MSEKHEPKIEQEPNWEWRLPPDVDLIDRKVDELATALKRMNWSDEDISDIGVAFKEALSNAILYGSLGIEGNKGEGKEELFQVARERYAAIKYNYDVIKLSVKVFFYFTDSSIRIVVEDNGKGYDKSNLLDPKKPENLLKQGGRGLMLMQHYMNVSFKEKNRIVILSKVKTSKIVDPS